jgi:hypothetical protein
MTDKRSLRGLHLFFLVAGGSFMPSMTGMNMQFDNGRALVSCLCFLFGLVFMTQNVFMALCFTFRVINTSPKRKHMPVFSFWTGIYDTKCVYGFMFFVLQFTNGGDEKKKKKV